MEQRKQNRAKKIVTIFAVNAEHSISTGFFLTRTCQLLDEKHYNSKSEMQKHVGFFAEPWRLKTFAYG